MSDTDRPNVLVFLTDQQRWDTVGAYGNPMEITPELDAMAERGVQLEHAFTPQPLCTPARACLQSGRYGTQTGVKTNNDPLPELDHLLAREFRRAGYDTAYVGKWHLSSVWTDPVPPEERGGYEYWRAVNSLEFNTQSYEGFVYDEEGTRVPFSGYRVDAMTDLAVEFLREDRDDPFFLFLSQLEPHHENDLRRYIAPDGYDWRYRNPYVPPDLLADAETGDWMTELPDYYGCCARLDESLGRILGELEEQGLADDTIVLFTSDHGCHFETRGGGQKGTCHESSIRVPAVLQGPGFNHGERIDESVNLLDVPPTLLEAAGIEVPDVWQGTSFRPLLGDEATDWRDDVYIQLSNDGHVVRTEEWKYAVSTDEDGTYRESHLYDLENDPWETENLLGRPEHQRVATRLRRRLQERMVGAGEPSPDIRRSGRWR